MKDYLFSSKERRWSINSSVNPEVNHTFHHEPYTKDGKSLVKVTTVNRNKKEIKIYEIKSETIELVYRWRDGWGESQVIEEKPRPRFVSMEDLIKPQEHTGEILLAKYSSTSLGDFVLTHKILEVGAPNPTNETVYVYGKGVGLINISERYKVPNPLTGETIPSNETRLDVASVDWIKCEGKSCSIHDQ